MQSHSLTLRLTMAQLVLVASVAQAADWPMFGRDATRNAVSPEPNPPTRWNAELLPSRWEDGKVVESVPGSSNVKWAANLGTNTFGDPVVSDGLVWVGTNNDKPGGDGKPDASVLACFRESDGRPLYRYVSPRLPERVHDWPEASMTGPPLIEGDRLYLVSNRAEVICFDIGPLLRSKEKETRTPDDEPHVLWKLDMMAGLGIFPRGPMMGIARLCSPASWKEFLYVITPNGVDEGRLKVPAPNAPALVCLEKSTGRVNWSDASPGERILEEQSASPLVLDIDETPQCVAPLGDGWVRSFHARTGELLWEFDMNAKDSLFELGGRGPRNYLLAPPVFAAGKVYIASGRNPESGDGYGRLVCVDPTKRGDISSELAVDADGNRLPRRRERAIDLAKSERAVPNPNSGLVWEFTGKNERGGHRFGRTNASVAVANGLAIVPDVAGFIYCLDAATGEHYWTHDAFAAIFAGPLIAGNQAYVADEDGEVAVLKLAKDLHVLAENVHTSSTYCTPVFANGTLYVADRNQRYAIAGEAEPGVDPAPPIESDRKRVETRRVPRATFTPTPDDVVLKTLELAGVGSDDVVYDLGSGDGRIVIAAAKTYGCRATGVELSADLVRLSRERAREAGVEHLTQFERGDLFDTDFSEATVVTLYLLQTQNEALLPKLRDLKPGARVVAHHFPVPGLKPNRTVKVRSTETKEEHALYLYTAPFAVAAQRRGY